MTDFPGDPRELAGKLVIGPGRSLEDRPRGVKGGISRLALCPSGIGPQRCGGVEEFLGGDLKAGIGHAAR